jgi:hypothetical protein
VNTTGLEHDLSMWGALGSEAIYNGGKNDCGFGGWWWVYLGFGERRMWNWNKCEEWGGK